MVSPDVYPGSHKAWKETSCSQYDYYLQHYVGETRTLVPAPDTFPTPISVWNGFPLARIAVQYQQVTQLITPLRVRTDLLSRILCHLPAYYDKPLQDLYMRKEYRYISNDTVMRLRVLLASFGGEDLAISVRNRLNSDTLCTADSEMNGHET